MAPSRTETVRRLFELFNEGIDEVPTDLVSPEIEFVSPLTSVRGRPYRGYEDALQWLSDVREHFGRWEYKLAEVREAGGTVVATGSVQMEGRVSGVSLDQEVTWVASFAGDGRVVRMEVLTPPG